MSKIHDYEAHECLECIREDRAFNMLDRCLESIEDLLQECDRRRASISIQQYNEMHEIIKDARVQNLLT